MVLNIEQAGLWSDRSNWPVIADAIDARNRHAGALGHEGVCVLDTPDTLDRRRMEQCTLALPACQTMLGFRMRDEIAELITDNTSNPIARRALILEGEATYGKTTATMLEVLRRSRAIIAEHGPTVDGVRARIPWVYVEVGAQYGYRDIAAAVLTHMGIPVKQSFTAATLMGQLRDVLPRYGCEGIVIDDAHNLRGAPGSSRADGLKNLLTGVPASLVFVGLSPMSNSALLNGATGKLGTSVKQIARRSQLIQADLGRSGAAARADWDYLMTSLVRQFHLPEGDGREAFANDRLADSLYEVTGGLFGGAYDLLRRAAKVAIRSDDVSFEAAIDTQLVKAKKDRVVTSRQEKAMRTGSKAEWGKTA